MLSAGPEDGVGDPRAGLVYGRSDEMGTAHCRSVDPIEPEFLFVSGEAAISTREKERKKGRNKLRDSESKLSKIQNRSKQQKSRLEGDDGGEEGVDREVAESFNCGAKGPGKRVTGRLAQKNGKV